MYVNRYETLVQAVADLRRRGFTTDFELERERFIDRESGETYASDAVAIKEHHRFEGASSAGDMSVIYAIEAKDGRKGMVIDGYGPTADPDLGRFLDGVAVDEQQ